MVRESPVEPYPQLWKGGTTCRCADAPGSSKPEQDVLGSPVCLEQFVPIFLEGSFLLSSRGWIVDAIGYPFFELKLCLV